MIRESFLCSRKTIRVKKNNKGQASTINKALSKLRPGPITIFSVRLPFHGIPVGPQMDLTGNRLGAILRITLRRYEYGHESSEMGQQPGAPSC